MKPEGQVFDRAWREACSVKSASRGKVEDLILKGHYLHEWPAQIQLVLGLFRGGDVLGVMTFSSLRGELIPRFGPDTWELSRLFLKDSVPKNGESYFIGQAVRYIRRISGHPKALISFADPSHGHSGVIYRAANWTEVEHPSKSLFHYPLGGDRVPQARKEAVRVRRVRF